MNVKTLPVGQLETNCYVLTNENTLECVVIDPGDESNTIMDYIESLNLKCTAIMLTHGHFDHCGVCDEIAEQTGAKVYMHPADDRRNISAPYFPYTLPENGQYYREGDKINAAGIDFEVIETPGHTPGSVTLAADGALFTGDTLFRGSAGRTDLTGGDPQALAASLLKLCALSDEYEVYPGHMDATSLIREKSFNFYCRQAKSN